MPREEMVGRLGEVFRAHGYEGASLTRLAGATGLVKASLYHQFPNGKVDMAAAVLGALEAEIVREVIEPSRDATLTPRARAKCVAQGLERVYHGGKMACAIDVFGIGEAGPLFRTHLARAAAGIMAALSVLMRDAGVAPKAAATRAEDALIAVQGALVLARATGDAAPFRRVLRELPDRLLAAV